MTQDSADQDPNAHRFGDGVETTSTMKQDTRQQSSEENENGENAEPGEKEALTPFRKPVWLRIFGHDISAPFLLLLLSLFLFVPGQWTVPPLDRDEPRFTQATKQMLETGDYVDIRFQDQARHKKPVGIYWLQAAAVKLTGHGTDAPLWVYRLPSVIGAFLCVLAAFWLARAFMGPAGALIVGALVAMSIIMGVEARLAKTDAVLYATIIIAQGALARIWLRNSDKRLWGLGFIFWTALAASVLIKGPIGLMVVGLTVVGLFVLTRRFRWFKAASPILGLIWLIALVSPWIVAIWIATDGTFFTEAIGRDLLGKVGQGQEGHGAPPLTHLGAMFGVFWPLPAFFILAVPLIWRERKSQLVTFCLVWFVPSWIIFELVATKLPHYTMPLFPALALLVAAALVEGAGSDTKKWMRWVATCLLVIPAIGLTAVAFGGPFVLGIWPSPPGAILVGIGMLCAFSAARWLLKGPALYAFPAVMLASVFVTVGVWGFVGPSLSPIWVSPRLVAAIDEIPGCADPSNRAVVTSGFHEPSFIFLGGTDIKIVPPREAAEFLSDNSSSPSTNCRVAAIESRDEPAFLEAAKELGLVPEVRKRVDGLNINGGDDVDIALYEKALPKSGAETGNEDQQ